MIAGSILVAVLGGRSCVAGAQDVVQIGVMDDDTVCLRPATGPVRCHDLPTAAAPVTPPSWSVSGTAGAHTLAAGEGSACVVLDTSEVACWRDGVPGDSARLP